MTNKEIRKKAWELCKRHFWRLLGVTLFIALITSPFLFTYGAVIASIAAGSVPGTGAVLTSVVSIVLLMILASVLEAGLLQYISNLWNERSAGIRTLFAHARRVMRLIGIGLLTILCMYAVMIPGMLIVSLLGAFVPFLTVIAGIALVIFLFCVLLRITPAMTAFILDPSRTAGQCIKASWRATKGNVRRIFRHNLALILPAFAASLLITLLTPATGAYASPVANTIVTVATLLFTALFSIYMQFGMYGLNELLLTTRSAYSNVPASELWENTIPLPASEEESSEDSNQP